MTEYLEPVLNYPEQLVWGSDEEKMLFDLFVNSKALVREEEEVQLVYSMGMPSLGSDDPIENMLDAECYRLAFEEENPLHLEMKQNQKAYAEKLERFMRHNLLFLSFTLVERRETLCDHHETFKRYATWEELQEQLGKLRQKLETLGAMTLVKPNSLSETLRHVV